MNIDNVYINDGREKEFNFNFPLLSGSEQYRLKIPLHVPFSGCVSELTQRLMSSFKLPAYVEEGSGVDGYFTWTGFPSVQRRLGPVWLCGIGDHQEVQQSHACATVIVRSIDLENALSEFIEHQGISYLDEEAGKAIDKIRHGESDIEDVIKFWEKKFKENTVEFGDKVGADDAELFSAVYHKVVHSPALQVILQQEHSYAVAVSEIISERDRQVQELTTRQTEEMCRAVDAVNITNTEADINELAGRHLDQQSLIHAQWDSQVDAIKESQRRHYRQWLMDKQTTTAVSSPLNSPMSILPPQVFTENVDGPLLQESFTIHLGSQMKQMHNIRILSADVLDFCQLRCSTSGTADPQPQRLQTALGLYSNDLCGLVLLSDSNLGSFSSSGIFKDFIKVCESSTEFHFVNVGDQLETIKSAVKEGISWRRDHVSRENTHQLLNLTSSEQQSRRSGTKYLQTGDVYLTHHSNLAEVHVVFHMVVDDTLRSNDINSRHPAILGLRNILKTACSCDITTLTVPVLLMHEMTEEMTVPWCNKRAELVFKCVKGFMIEMASWGGSELKNLQFLVPKGISEDVFASLATMLPSIFRVSNPLVFKAATSLTPVTKSKNEKSSKTSK